MLAVPFQEVDAVLEPLMELLEDKLQQYASECEKTVLKYLLKVTLLSRSFYVLLQVGICRVCYDKSRLCTCVAV